MPEAEGGHRSSWSLSAASPNSQAAHHRGLKNPNSHIYPRCLGFSFFHLILLGPSSRSALLIILLGPSCLWPWGGALWLQTTSCFYSNNWVWPPHPTPAPLHMINKFYLQRPQSSGVREKSERRWRPVRKPGQSISGQKCAVTL